MKLLKIMDKMMKSLSWPLHQTLTFLEVGDFQYLSLSSLFYWYALLGHT